MVFRWWANDGPLIVVFHQLKKTLSKLDPLRQNFLDPRMQMGNHVLCAKSAFMCQGHHGYPTLKTTTEPGTDVGSFDLRHHAVLESSTPFLCLRLTKCVMFLFMTKGLTSLCSAQADLRLCWSHATKSGCIHIQIIISRSLLF